MNSSRDSLSYVHLMKIPFDVLEVYWEEEKAAVEETNFKVCQKYVGILGAISLPMAVPFIYEYRASPNLQ